MAPGHPPDEAAWIHGHAHNPNPLAPQGDGGFGVRLPGSEEIAISIETLAQLPLCEVDGCLIVSTGHGVSGPFTFAGVRLDKLLVYAAAQAEGLAAGRPAWRQVDVIIADVFGTRLAPADLVGLDGRPILLAYRRNGQPLTREQGLVRLIVPQERDDALRQVKWVARIEVT
jgi:hypothetical protein